MRLVKDARLSLPLTEVMKIARRTSPLLDAPRLSSPRPRLRHGRRLAVLFHPNLTLNLYTLFFVLSLAHLPRLPPLLTSPNYSSPKESASVYATYLKSHSSVSQPKALRSRARGYLFELRRATCLKESYLSFCSPFSLAEFLAAASNLSSFTATGPDKVAYPMLKHLPRSGMNFLVHIFNHSLSFTMLSFHQEDIFYHSHPQDGKTSRLSYFHRAYLSHFLHLKNFLKASFYPVYSSSGI